MHNYVKIEIIYKFNFCIYDMKKRSLVNTNKYRLNLNYLELTRVEFLPQRTKVLMGHFFFLFQ